MRNLIVAVSLLGFAAVASAQEQTLIKGNVETHGFGTPVVKYSRVFDQDSVLVGARGGVIINKSFVLGAAAYGVANDVTAPSSAFPQRAPLDLQFGYGGLELEYIVKPESVAHLSVSSLVGVGGTRFVEHGSRFDRDDRIGDPDVFFVLEPGVNAEVNVTSWLHLNGGVSYRVVNGVEQVGLTNDDFRGAAATVSVRFIRR
jgi:hypothetical protein